MHMRKFTLLLTMVLGVFAANGQSCDDLFFSEYGEGSSNHKYIEIYNPSASAISLTGYTVYLSGNGGSYTNTFTTNATIASVMFMWSQQIRRILLSRLRLIRY